MTAKLSNPAAAKEPRRVWYGTQLWKNRRAHQLRIEPLCCLCKAEGRITPATIADHFPAHGGDYNVFVLGPLRSLCAPSMTACTSFKHKDYSTAIGVDGDPLDFAASINTFVRTGPTAIFSLVGVTRKVSSHPSSSPSSAWHLP